MAKLFHAMDAVPPALVSWEERWEGPDRGLLCSWARGLEKARETPSLREQALRGELPPLPWKGGADKAIKLGRRVGSLHYLAMYKRLRGEPLNIDPDAGATLTCTSFKTVVNFTGNAQAVALDSIDGP